MTDKSKNNLPKDVVEPLDFDALREDFNDAEYAIDETVSILKHAAQSLQSDGDDPGARHTVSLIIELATRDLEKRSAATNLIKHFFALKGRIAELEASK